jgi:hypothetical protein
MAGYPCCCCQCNDCDCCGSIPSQYSVTLDNVTDGEICLDCDTLNTTFILDVDDPFVCDYIVCDTICGGVLNFCIRMSRLVHKIVVELFSVGLGGYSWATWEVNFTKCYSCSKETDLDLIAHNNGHCGLDNATCHVAPVVPLMLKKPSRNIIKKDRSNCCHDKNTRRPIDKK